MRCVCALYDSLKTKKISFHYSLMFQIRFNSVEILDKSVLEEAIRWGSWTVEKTEA